MTHKIVNILLFIGVTIFFWIAHFYYLHVYLLKGFYTFLALAVTYVIFKVAFERFFVKQIKDSKTRYSFRKTVSIIYIIVLLGIIVRIWIETTQTLLVSYGLIAAGVAIALQDLFKNFAGGILLFVGGMYRVGDRIEINSKLGDVIDISILYTTLLELGEWVKGEQATGRLAIIPNGKVISGTIINYTKDHSFIWDEMSIPITYDSDWKEAVNKILDIVKKETDNMTLKAENSIAKLEEKYYLSKRIIEPAIYLTLTDNWITFNIRYITEVRGRRLLRNKLSHMILDMIQKDPNIKIASTTLDITSFPDINKKNKIACARSNES
jgi:small-conductance mechanosensitive channel